MSIRLDSLSFSQIMDSLSDYFNSQSQNEKWRDFYESSTGRMFIRLLSAFASFISYMTTVARRENFITYAQNRTSLVGISQNLGYSVVRGKNEKVTINITPNMTGFVPEFSVVGRVKNLDLVSTQELYLNKGTSTDIEVFVGNLRSEQISVNTEKLKVFRFTSSKVSDYIRLKLNDVIVPLSRNLKDLFSDTYVAISNPLGAVDVSYIQEGSYKYEPSDVLTLEYLELDSISYELSNMSLDYGTINTVVFIVPYVSPETNDSIRINAPLYHETQVLIRARNDYLKQFKNLGQNLISTSSRDFSPAIVELTYIKNDYTLMPTNEKEATLNLLESMRAMGVPMPRITDPRHFKLDLDFNIRKYSNTAISVVDVESDVRSIIGTYEKKLKPSMDIIQLEHDMEDFSYVKRARISIKSSPRQNNIKYRLGDFISNVVDDGNIYMAYDIIKKSQPTEPMWLFSEGTYIADGDLVWKCIPRYDKLISEWIPERHYKVGDLVRPTLSTPESLEFMFEVTKINRRSSPTKPIFTTVVQDFTEDNQLIWVCKPKVISNTAWQANTNYTLGDSILEGDFSYEVIGFKASTDNNPPVFKTDASYIITNVLVSPDNVFVVSGDKSEHFLPNDTIKVLGNNGNEGYYKVVTSYPVGTDTNIEVLEEITNATAGDFIYFEDKYTKDNEILWKTYSRDNEVFTYGWKDYIKVTTNISLT